ncbi:MAG: hypothetical protein Kow0090_19020 [Myxococcota bacterium]
MYEYCSIVGHKVNEKVVRLNALYVLFAVVLFALTEVKWLMVVFAVDFLIRGFLSGEFSPFNRLNAILLALFRSKPIMIDAGPKRFAAKLGFLFSAVTIALYLAGYVVPAIVVAAMLGFCAALEAVLNYCVGCKIYALLQSVGLFGIKNNHAA